MAKGTLKIAGADSFTAADLAPDSVGTSEIAALAVDTAELADNAVTLAKMAGGTDGQILTYDASGDPVAVGPGTDGQVLTSTGAGSPPAFETLAAIPSGTKMLFHQSAAPTGWTKVTTTGTGSASINDVGLRIVTGTITDGVAGSVAFDTAFASQTIPSHTLATSEMPSHSHGINFRSSGNGTLAISSWSTNVNSNVAVTQGLIQSVGGGGSHGHGSIDLNVKYIDLIVASKD